MAPSIVDFNYLCVKPTDRRILEPKTSYMRSVFRPLEQYLPKNMILDNELKINMTLNKINSPSHFGSSGMYTSVPGTLTPVFLSTQKHIEPEHCLKSKLPSIVQRGRKVPSSPERENWTNFSTQGARFLPEHTNKTNPKLLVGSWVQIWFHNSHENSV